MGTYQLRAPAQAIQYARSVNEAEIAELVKGTGAGSYSNARGPLEVTNLNGRVDRVVVEAGEWVVKLGHGFTVLSNAEFQALFIAE
ncbi:hypothetical protein [Aeromicrobium endophyticum]|uniref:Uncharacterized protein n=1 Tax=Aeromicrobium endophyticum TaxID=2292704 RepID=A0A371P4L9_9ACTN|nr:hypothetical protein [Aeromicrobium endophyticum]REK70470.1 hypothetical protein DX116_15150 [Aeromicrobium endophyticum]